MLASCSRGVGTVRTFRYRRSGVVGNAETYFQLYVRSVTLSATPRRCRPRNRQQDTAAGWPNPRRKGRAMDDISEDFTRLDDSALLSRRAEMRAELERLPPASPGHAALTALYDKTTEEVDARARRAWTRAS